MNHHRKGSLCVVLRGGSAWPLVMSRGGREWPGVATQNRICLLQRWSHDALFLCHSATYWLIANFVVWWLLQNCSCFCIVVVAVVCRLRSLEAAGPFLISCKLLSRFLFCSSLFLHWLTWFWFCLTRGLYVYSYLFIFFSGGDFVSVILSYSAPRD